MAQKRQGHKSDKYMAKSLAKLCGMSGSWQPTLAVCVNSMSVWDGGDFGLPLDKLLLLLPSSSMAADYDFYLALGLVFYSHSGQAALELGLDSGPVGSCCYACRFVRCLGVSDSQQQQHEKQPLQLIHRGWHLSR